MQKSFQVEFINDNPVERTVHVLVENVLFINFSNTAVPWLIVPAA
jgi:hypothetical protein